jgi:hypothetical protein
LTLRRCDYENGVTAVKDYANFKHEMEELSKEFGY